MSVVDTVSSTTFGHLKQMELGAGMRMRRHVAHFYGNVFHLNGHLIRYLAVEVCLYSANAQAFVTQL